ncbi:MAG: TniQ family protein [Cyanobacteriota/Melainabacteria group bacterium]
MSAGELLNGADMEVTRWPARLSVLPGERLSSWLRRIGIIYGCSIDDLLRYDLKLAYLKASELDMKVSDELLKVLSIRTGISAAAIKKMTYPATVPFLISGTPSDRANFRQCSVFREPSNGRQVKLSQWMRWFCRESKHRVVGCRLCLADYPNAAVKLPWALSVVMSCPSHGVMLETAEIDRWSVKFSNQVKDAPALVCGLDRRTWEAVTTGFVQLPGGSVYAGQWFRLLHAIFEELNAALIENDQSKWQLSVWREAGYFPSFDRPEPFKFDKSCAALIAVAIDQLEKGIISPNGTHASLFRKPVS